MPKTNEQNDDRAEDGVIEFGSEGRGFFLQGKSAFFYGLNLQAFLDKHPETAELDITTRVTRDALKCLAADLLSVDVRRKAEVPGVTLKPFAHCKATPLGVLVNDAVVRLQRGPLDILVLLARIGADHHPEVGTDDLIVACEAFVREGPNDALSAIAAEHARATERDRHADDERSIVDWVERLIDMRRLAYYAAARSTDLDSSNAEIDWSAVDLTDWTKVWTMIGALATSAIESAARHAAKAKDAST